MREASLKCRYADSAATTLCNIMSMLKDIKYVVTTTDERAFIGFTAHWIEPSKIKWCWAALSCECL